MQERIKKILMNVIDKLNTQLPKEKRLEKSMETILMGGVIDSLTLTNFILLTEQKIEEEFGYLVSLADERAMEQTPPPFTSVSLLANYIETLLKENLE